MLANAKEITLPQLGDGRGKLIVLEELAKVVPFEIKRVFYIFDTLPDVVRGNHAHHANRQMLVCVSGACTITCEFPDGRTAEYRLDWPHKGLLLEGMVWHSMKDFSQHAVLLVLASEHYDESDYVRSYDEFKRISAEAK